MLQRSATPSRQRATQKVHVRARPSVYNFLLSPTDIPVFVLYTVAFVCLSDFIVPSGILRGGRSRTTCYYNNITDIYKTVVLRFCVLGQHGYWWAMGAMSVSSIKATLF